MTIATPPPLSMVDDSTVAEVRSSLRGLLSSRHSPQSRLEFIDQDSDYDEALWSAITRELGLAGLLIPEDLGGSGASARESAAVLTELGRSVAPVPYLSSAVIATTALVQCAQSGSSAAAGVLVDLADGAIAVLAIPATHSSHTALTPTVAAHSAGDGSVRLSGSISQVIGAAGATSLLVPVDHGGTLALALITTNADQVQLTRRTAIDSTRPTADLHFDSISGDLVATGDDARAAVRAGLDIGTALIASEQVGICEWALATTTDYLTLRHQFGRPIGSYQALRHRAAQLWIDTNHARAAAAYAAATMAENNRDAAVAGALAKAYCGETTLRVVEEALQMHGGIGFTWDHPIHLYLKRAFADSILLGDAEIHKRALAELVDLPEPTDPRSRV